MRQIDGVVAGGGEQRHAQRKQSGKDHADGGVLFQIAVFGQPADAQRGEDAEDQRANGQRPAQQESDDHAGQNRVRQRVAKEGHPAQHHVRSQHRTHHAHDDGREQGPHHEVELQGVEEKVHVRKDWQS